MITVYRIEHSTFGTGPFRPVVKGNLLIGNLQCFYNLCDRHDKIMPAPHKDFELKRLRTEYCALITEEQISILFPSQWLKELTTVGFRLYEIQLTNAKCSANQALYEKNKIIKQTDITDKYLKL
jgi:hypothetical protein